MERRPDTNRPAIAAEAKHAWNKKAPIQAGFPAWTGTNSTLTDLYASLRLQRQRYRYRAMPDGGAGRVVPAGLPMPVVELGAL